MSAKILYFYKQTNTNDRNKRTKETANNQIYAVSNHDSVKQNIHIHPPKTNIQTNKQTHKIQTEPDPNNKKTRSNNSENVL